MKFRFDLWKCPRNRCRNRPHSLRKLSPSPSSSPLHLAFPFGSPKKILSRKSWFSWNVSATLPQTNAACWRCRCRCRCRRSWPRFISSAQIVNGGSCGESSRHPSPPHYPFYLTRTELQKKCNLMQCAVQDRRKIGPRSDQDRCICYSSLSRLRVTIKLKKHV